jgi:hypothetical protein
MELTPEAKELIAKEVESLTKSSSALLQELEIYRWALRVLFVLLFGGTLLGIFKLQAYLDDRIQKRSEQLSGFVYGSAAQSSGDPRTAIEQYKDFLGNLESAVLRPSEPIRSIYYLKFIQALADDNQTEPDGDFEVRGVYLTLIGSKFFKKDWLLNEGRWRNDASYLNAWGRCQVKFGSSLADIESAYKLFERAVQSADRPSDKAANHFAMAMVSLIENKEDEAKTLFLRAAEVSPKTHAIKDYVGIFKNDLEGEYQIWERGAQLLKNPGLADRYNRTMSKLIADDVAQNKRLSVR